MTRDFNIGAKSGLLEDKHMLSMGNSIWLYLWFLDKQPRGTDKVLRGTPITYELVSQSFGQLSRRTYARWLSQLLDGNYISATRTPRGMSISIVKSKKWVQTVTPKVAQQELDLDVPKTAQPKVKVIRHNRNSDVPKRVEGYNDNGTSNIRATSAATKATEVSTIVDTGKLSTNDAKSMVGKLYYEVIKVYDLPVMNHTTINKKIKELENHSNLEEILTYLTFLRDQYKQIEFDHKPQLYKAIDIYDKRQAIIGQLKRLAKEGRKIKTGIIT